MRSNIFNIWLKGKSSCCYSWELWCSPLALSFLTLTRVLQCPVSSLIFLTVLSDSGIKLPGADRGLSEDLSVSYQLPASGLILGLHDRAWQVCFKTQLAVLAPLLIKSRMCFGLCHFYWYPRFPILQWTRKKANKHDDDRSPDEFFLPEKFLCFFKHSFTTQKHFKGNVAVSNSIIQTCCFVCLFLRKVEVSFSPFHSLSQQ